MKQNLDTGKISERLSLLRRKMKQDGIDFYLIPTSDFHNSEYVSDYFKVREFFSGFTGSNGTLLVWRNGAGLWTDGRYFIQAEKELEGSGITLFRMLEEGVPTVPEFLSDNLKKGQCLGFDGRVITAGYGERLKKLAESRDAFLRIDRDPADGIWADRPSMPCNPVVTLDETVSGRSTENKLKWIRKILAERNADAVLLTKLDDIMWLFNLRGNDVECNPVALSYAYVTAEKALLFLRKDAEFDKRSEDGLFEVREYENVFPVLKEELSQVQPDKFRLIADPGNVNFSMACLIRQAGISCLDMPDPVEAEKAVRNTTEIERMRQIFLKDSVAVTKFIYWLKKTVCERTVTEVEAAEYLDRLRQSIPEFMELSFPTISAYGENAAMMHYEATPQNFSRLERKGMLLVDSGGQYSGGTTDVTRTIVLGPVPEEVRQHYSAVTEGMLSLLNAVFLKGCTGRNLDILARKPVWKLYRDYKCGTGHGVGYMLNVHEGPHAIRWKPGKNEAPLAEGMTVTDEPGIYVEGSHGIRIENVLLVKQICKNGDGTFLGFENLTFVPIDREAVRKEYMSEEAWNAFRTYQEEVYEKISPFLTEEEAEWLREETSA